MRRDVAMQEMVTQKHCRTLSAGMGRRVGRSLQVLWSVGLLRSRDLDRLVLAARAMGYGARAQPRPAPVREFSGPGNQKIDHQFTASPSGATRRVSGQAKTFPPRPDVVHRRTVHSASGTSSAAEAAAAAVAGSPDISTRRTLNSLTICAPLGGKVIVCRSGTNTP